MSALLSSVDAVLFAGSPLEAPVLSPDVELLEFAGEVFEVTAPSVLGLVVDSAPAVDVLEDASLEAPPAYTSAVLVSLEVGSAFEGSVVDAAACNNLP